MKNTILNKNSILITIIYLFGIFFLLLVLGYNSYNGGNSWQQGDWLINNHYSTIRRGWLGSIFIDLSYYLKINIIYIVTVVQGTIITFLFLILWRTGVKQSNNDIVFFLLISPIFIMYGFNDLDSSLRKEIIAYLAFIPLLIYSEKKENLLLYITTSSIIYLIAVLSHEANSFFLPFYIMAITIISKKKPRYLLPIFSIYLLISSVGIIYALTYSSIPDYMSVCEPIINLGVKNNICNGAIRWLEFDLHYAIETTKELVLSEKLYKFIISYIFSIFIFVYLMKNYFSIKFCFFASIISSLAFLPLYIMATDWGRWINYYASALTFILLIWINTNNSKIPKINFNKYQYIIFLLFLSSWGVIHVGGYISLKHSYIYRVILLMEAF